MAAQSAAARASIRDEVRATVEAERQQFAPPPPPAEPPPPDPTPDELRAALDRNHAGDAELAARYLRWRYCYDNQVGKWFRWPEDGHAWEPDVTRQVERALEPVAVLYEGEASRLFIEAKRLSDEGGDKHEIESTRDLAGQFKRRAFQLRSPSRIKDVLRVLGTGALLGIAGDEWDARPELLPFRDCAVDLRSGVGSPGRPADFMSRSCPTSFAGINVDAPFWDDFLDKAFCRDQDLRDYFELFIGYSVTGYSHRKEFLVCYGPSGDNGKSVLFETVKRLLGKWAGKIPVAILYEEKVQRSAGAASPDIMLFRGLRMAITSEATDRRRFDTGRLKELISGGDELKGRALNSDFVDFPASHALWVHTNRIPELAGNDPAFKNRLRILPFNARFTADPSEVDESNHVYPALPRDEVEARLREEEPGIVAWIVRCAMRYLAALDQSRTDPAVFDPPACVLAEQREYWIEQDEVGQFLAACCLEDPDASETMGDLYAAYRAWMMEEKQRPKKDLPSMKSLAKDLKGRPGLRRKQSNVVHYFGLELSPDWRAKAEEVLELDRAEKDRKLNRARDDQHGL